MKQYEYASDYNDGNWNRCHLGRFSSQYLYGDETFEKLVTTDEVGTNLISEMKMPVAFYEGKMSPALILK